MRHTTVDLLRYTLFKGQANLSQHAALGVIEGLSVFAAKFARDGKLGSHLPHLKVWLEVDDEILQALVNNEWLAPDYEIPNWEKEKPRWLKAWDAANAKMKGKKKSAPANNTAPKKETIAEAKKAEPIKETIEAVAATVIEPQALVPFKPEQIELPFRIRNTETTQLWRRWCSMLFFAGKLLTEERALLLLTELEIAGKEATRKALRDAVGSKKLDLEIIHKAKPVKANPPFKSPTKEEVLAACKEMKVNLDADLFVAHYESVGWVLKGGQPIKSWRACIVTWVKRQATFAARDAEGKSPPARDNYKRLDPAGPKSSPGRPILPMKQAKEIGAA